VTRAASMGKPNQGSPSGRMTTEGRKEEGTVPTTSDPRHSCIAGCRARWSPAKLRSSIHTRKCVMKRRSLSLIMLGLAHAEKRAGVPRRPRQPLPP
jgi:hypothetical protein